MRQAGRAPKVPTRTVHYRSAAGLGADCAAVLSRGRFFLNTRRTLPVGTRLALVLRCGTSERLRLAGRVAHVAPLGNDLNETPGMLVALDPPGPATLARLVRLSLGRRFGDASIGPRV